MNTRECLNIDDICHLKALRESQKDTCGRVISSAVPLDAGRERVTGSGRRLQLGRRIQTKILLPPLLHQYAKIIVDPFLLPSESTKRSIRFNGTRTGAVARGISATANERIRSISMTK